MLEMYYDGKWVVVFEDGTEEGYPSQAEALMAMSEALEE